MAESNHIAKLLAETRLPTIHGNFKMLAFDSGKPDQPHVVLVSDTPVEGPVPVRIHSECMTGDVFGSTRCDCGEQRDVSMGYIQHHGGIFIYLRQEGRGIGLVNKMKAYNLQDEGMDTVAANHALGFPTDQRDFGIAIAILQYLQVQEIRLLTNNPEKINVFNGTDIQVVERVPVLIPVRPENTRYLLTKKQDLGHLI